MKGKQAVLGVNYGGHDTSAALMIDGTIVSACEQERYSRKKHCRDFPTDAIKDCVDIAGISLSEVDEIAFGFDPIYHIQEAYLRSALESVERMDVLLQDIDRVFEKRNTKEIIRKHIDYEGPIKFYRHHECHLASAYYPSGFNNALIASYDGIGEIETGLLAVGREGKIDLVHQGTRFPDSLGLLYSAVTYFLGWKHHSDEGIVMGLATYGNPDNRIPGRNETYYQIFETILQETGDFDYKVNQDWIAYHRKRDSWVSGKFISVFGQPKDPNKSPEPRHMDLAAALQRRLEFVVLNQLEKLKEKYGIDYLTLAGGVALNCSMNGKIESSGLFKEIYVQPASGDAGVALGACYLSEFERNQDLLPKRVVSTYFGGGSDSKEIKKALGNVGIEPTKSKNTLSWTSTQLSNGRIVAWYQGRSEFGPRALGNRSILTRPYPASMKDYLNKRVKFRESFRPFAPAVMSNYLNKYFQIRQESPHMLIACQAKETAKVAAPATVHVDNTCRVQSVSRDQNRLFYDLLDTFHKETGCPILLNTSFNIKGQPIVNTAQEAIDCFLSTNIDCLVLGDYIVDKNSLSKELLRNARKPKIEKLQSYEYFGQRADTYGRDYEEKPYDKYPANKYRLNIVKNLMTQLKPDNILDVGCGTGEPLIAIKKMGLDIEGFDISESMLHKAHENLELNQLGTELILKNDMENLVGYAKESYDCLLALGVVYYAQNFNKTMQSLMTLLRPGGNFIFSLRNSLFALYSANEYTVDFVRETLIPDQELSSGVSNVLSDVLAKSYTYPLKTKQFDTVDTANVHSIMHNPLTIEESILECFGLELQNIFYYHYHALPPVMEHLLRKEFQELSHCLEGTNNWRSKFIASSFVVHAKKQDQASN